MFVAPLTVRNYQLKQAASRYAGNSLVLGLVDAHRPQNPTRKAALEEVNEWRNAIAHQDFTAAMLSAGRPTLTLAQVQTWRKACDGLARSFNDVMRGHVQTMTGTVPW